MRHVSWNLANYHTTVQKLLVRHVLNKSKLCTPSVNPALISPILPHPFLWVAFPPSAPLTHHSHYPSPLHSSTPGLKLSFSTSLSHNSLPFLLLDWLHGFPGLLTDTSEHIRFYSLVFHSSCSPLSVVVPCCRLIYSCRLLIACQNSISFHIVLASIVECYS